MQNNYLRGFTLVIISGVIWSFSAPLVRLLEDAEIYRLQYLLYRSLIITLVVLIFILFREGRNFLNTFKRIDSWSLFGGLVMSAIFFGWIYALTTTTVAITLLMLGLSPVLSAFLGYLVLGERLSRITIINMIIVITGITIMVWGSDKSTTILGVIYGFFVALGFAIYTITIRKNPEIPKLLTPAIAGFFCMIWAIILIIVTDSSFEIPSVNIGISVMSGLVIGVGLILYAFGAKYLPSGELVMLSLLEVVLGIFWAWLPILGIHEVPSTNTLIGGCAIVMAIILQGINARKIHVIPMP
ncbi:MAG TPA: DMT family transporter [Candidatus Thioglobus sp.]|jgi:drug/metabolite transporter (DMT)-like permease|nr:DMT family transporter [Candidatus Thioglobus sp.]